MNDESVKTRKKIVVLLHEAHNQVNARTGKRLYSLEEHYKVYRFHARKRIHYNNVLMITVGVLCIAMLYRRRKTLSHN